MINNASNLIVLLMQTIGIITIKKMVRKSGPIYTGLTAGILLYYCFVPIIILLLGFSEKNIINFYNYGYVSRVYSSDFFDVLFSCICVLFFYIVFSLFYNKIRIIKDSAQRNLYAGMKLKGNYLQIISLFANITLMVGGASLLVYALSFGSISRAIDLAGTVRYFHVSATHYISYYASLMIIPAAFITITPWCYLILVGYTNSRKYKLLFILSFLLGALFYVLKAGRAPLLIYFLGLLMPILMRMFKHPWKLLIIGSLVMLPVLDILDSLFDGVKLSEYTYNFVSYTNQFAYPFSTLTEMKKIINEYGIRYGQDFLTTFLGLLPGLTFNSSYEIISQHYGGINWKLTGSTPTDLISFLLLEFHVWGVLFGGIFGLFAKCIDERFSQYDDKKYGVQSVYAILVISSLWLVSTADFESVVRNFIWLGLCIVIIMTTKRR